MPDDNEPSPSDQQEPGEQPAAAEGDPGPIGTDIVMKGGQPGSAAYRVPEQAAAPEPEPDPGDPGPIETEIVIGEEPGDPGPIGTVEVTEGERSSDDQ